jgi:L-alanine-DL-glutamate epimerase-like enolase superfamily enzyme
MKIVGCTTHAVQVNFEDAMTGTHVVLRLLTDEGIVGIAYVSRITSATARPMTLLIEGLVDSLLTRDPRATAAIHHTLYLDRLGVAVSGLELRAASAIDVACWDIAGKACGLPVWRMAGGFRSHLPVSANWGLMPGRPQDVVASHLADLLGRGFRAVKAPCGLAPLDEAITHVRWIRQCAGPETGIIVDGNFQWGLRAALHFARETQDCALTWLEDPVPAHDYEAMRDVTAQVSVPTCAGEVFEHPHQFARLLHLRCSDLVMIDQDLGFTGFLRVAAMAQAHGIQVVNHLAPEVLAHALAGVPNGQIVGLVPWGQPLFEQPLQVRDGEIFLSEQPGFGLTLDEDVLRRCALDA